MSIKSWEKRGRWLSPLYRVHLCDKRVLYYYDRKKIWSNFSKNPAFHCSVQIKILVKKEKFKLIFSTKKILIFYNKCKKIEFLSSWNKTRRAWDSLKSQSQSKWTSELYAFQGAFFKINKNEVRFSIHNKPQGLI